jgi:hypothetical protein
MDSGEILDRIKTLSKGVKISMPEKVFYSGPNYSEVAVYFGDTKKYTDLIDFWVSILFWVSNDKMEYDDISILNEKKEYPSKLYYCKEIDLRSEELIEIINKLKTLNHFSEDMPIKRCFKMSQEWHDIKYMFDCEENFFLYNWYTGE